MLETANGLKRRKEFAPPSEDTPEMSALQSKFFNTLPLHLEWQKQPRGVIQTITGRELIQGLLWSDILSGAKFQVCRNPDCPTDESYVGQDEGILLRAVCSPHGFEGLPAEKARRKKEYSP